MLELKTHLRNGVYDIELIGALDSITAFDFRDWMVEKSTGKYTHFALNCAKLEFVSSRGIGVLTEIYGALRSKGRNLVLYHVTNEVLNILTFLKIPSEIQVCEDFEGVMASFRGKKSVARNLAVDDDEETWSATTANGVGSHDEEMLRVPLPDDDGFREAEAADRSKSANGGEPASIGSQTATLPREDGYTDHDSRYIDLSNDPRVHQPQEPTGSNVIYCPNCGENLRVSRRGLYLCPECRTRFHYPFE